jgi:hypothetical protein
VGASSADVSENRRVMSLSADSKRRDRDRNRQPVFLP